METNNLKHILIDKIISISDKNLLERIDDLIGEVNLEKPVFKVSNPQRNMLDSSEEDIKNGNIVSDETVNEEEDTWLSE